MDKVLDEKIKKLCVSTAAGRIRSKGASLEGDENSVMPSIYLWYML